MVWSAFSIKQEASTWELFFLGRKAASDCKQVQKKEERKRKALWEAERRKAHCPLFMCNVKETYTYCKCPGEGRQIQLALDESCRSLGCPWPARSKKHSKGGSGRPMCFVFLHPGPLQACSKAEQLQLREEEEWRQQQGAHKTSLPCRTPRHGAVAPPCDMSCLARNQPCCKQWRVMRARESERERENEEKQDIFAGMPSQQ